MLKDFVVASVSPPPVGEQARKDRKKVGRPQKTQVPPGHEGGDLDAPKRLTLNLPAGVYRDLQIIAGLENRPMTDLVREALGLRKIVHDEADRGNKLAIVGPNGKKVLRELLLVR